MKKIVIPIVFSLLLTFSGTCQNNNDLKLWYKQPANAQIPDDKNGWKDDPEWLKALPLGNGSLGLMVFGDVNKERIQLNEESMWSGSPNDNDNPDASGSLTKIRRLLFDGKYKEATNLTNETQVCKGKGSGNGNGSNVPFGCFQTLGDLWIDFEKSSSFSNYQRELDLKNAVVRVSYSQDGVKFTRELFTSYPDQVMVARFTSDKKGQISFTSYINRPERFTTYTEDNQLIMSGSLSDGKGGNGLQYIARLKAISKNGTITYNKDKLIVKNADEVILLLSASTDYKLEYPDYKGRDYKNITNSNLYKASLKDYSGLLKTHLKEYQNYFQRVDFNITSGHLDLIPTDERIQAYKTSQNDSHLVELMFQYGRYLLISSSRPGTLPANLQGIWANKIQTPWNGDYHTDINVEMNYWPAEVTNLSELHQPLLNLIESLVIPGAKTAHAQYNLKGWVVHPITNVWGYTSPGEAASWGMHTGAGAWICQHISEHYAFTGDQSFLKKMYPVLKSSVEFYLGWLVKDPVSGKLVSGPAVSPENTFIAPDGSHSQISMGPTHDQEVIWNLFTDFITASKDLKVNDEFVDLVIAARDQLLEPKIGTDGRLMEWAQEFPEVEPGHRHISHLFAIFPGSQLNLVQTPELAEAARKSLDYRIANGGGHTGWSAAWLISQYARLQESEKAKKDVDVVLSKSTSPNLFGLHPPFQMDANFGFTAGVAEMLLQSYADIIQILPALPDDWPDGHINGLCARGGFVVDIDWKIMKPVNIKIFSKNGGICRVKYGNAIKEVQTEKGNSYSISFN
ncbi:MAG: glycoside hydrolase family 95 protein [Prolixibacteraceae bacterium]